MVSQCFPLSLEKDKPSSACVQFFALLQVLFGCLARCMAVETARCWKAVCWPKASGRADPLILDISV